VHGDLGIVQSKCFVFNFLFLVSKIGNWKQKNLPWLHFEFLSFVLRVLGMAEIYLFWSWPPIFNAKSRRLKVFFLALATLRVFKLCAYSFKHGRNHFFCRSTSKSKRPRPKKIKLAMLRTPNIKLGNSKCSQSKKNCFQPPTFDIKNRRSRAKKLL
jgi:hypothetical protein